MNCKMVFRIISKAIFWLKLKILRKINVLQSVISILSQKLNECYNLLINLNRTLITVSLAISNKLSR